MSLRATALAAPLFLVLAAPASAREPANVVFFHPDGASLAAWNAARIYWAGPDGELAFDRLPVSLVYRGHMADQLTGTSNGGATAHAFGVRVRGPGSYGMDGAFDDARPIRSAAGSRASVLREAAHAGHPVGVVNDGDLAEPGTGAFWAEAPHRDLANEIARQLIDGRPGFEAVDTPPVVALGGGEAFFLPTGTPRCGDVTTPDCAVHVDPVDGTTARREDGRNLVREFVDAGWIVLRTRAQFDDFRDELAARPDWTPRVLGLFAATDIFNDVPEERLIDAGMVRAALADDPRAGTLVLYGDHPGTLGFDPPLAHEMHAVALEVLARHARNVGRRFLLVTEIEGTDNFANRNNAIGNLVALREADRTVAATLTFIEREPRTLLLTGADSDASGFQLVSPVQESVNANPTGRTADTVRVPTDGVRGRGTDPFVAAPDAKGRTFPFTVTWVGNIDVYGGVVSRAAGARADELPGVYGRSFSNTDVFTVIRSALFGLEFASEDRR